MGRYAYMGVLFTISLVSIYTLGLALLNPFVIASVDVFGVHRTHSQNPCMHA